MPERTKETRYRSVAAKSPYLSVEQVAERYGVAVGTVHNWTSQRSIPYRKPTGGRVIFAPADLDLWDAGCELEVRQGKGRAIAVLPRKVAEPSRVAA